MEREVVVITGSSGFIGSALINKLAGRFALVGFDRMASRSPRPPSGMGQASDTSEVMIVSVPLSAPLPLKKGSQTERQAVPEAVPAFCLLDGKSVTAASTALRFPLFVKPVKSFFSLFAQQVANGDELRELARRADRHLREFVKPFNQLLARYTAFPLNGSHLLAEAPLRGRQVTVEGCMFHGEGRVIGITDSIMYQGTISFQRFEYPSALGPAIQERMAELALRFMRSIGFDDGLFNIEMFHDPGNDTIYIIEVNPRMCPVNGGGKPGHMAAG